MPRGACTFRQRDLRAAVKGVRDAGCAINRVEVDKHGTIIIHTQEDVDRPVAVTTAATGEPETNEWDAV